MNFNLNLFMDKKIIQFEEQNMTNKIRVVLRESNFGYVKGFLYFPELFHRFVVFNTNKSFRAIKLHGNMLHVSL